MTAPNATLLFNDYLPGIVRLLAEIEYKRGTFAAGIIHDLRSAAGCAAVVISTANWKSLLSSVSHYWQQYSTQLACDS